MRSLSEVKQANQGFFLQDKSSEQMKKSCFFQRKIKSSFYSFLELHGSPYISAQSQLWILVLYLVISIPLTSIYLLLYIYIYLHIYHKILTTLVLRLIVLRSWLSRRSSGKEWSIQHPRPTSFSPFHRFISHSCCRGGGWGGLNHVISLLRIIFLSVSLCCIILVLSKPDGFCVANTFQRFFVCGCRLAENFFVWWQHRNSLPSCWWNMLDYGRWVVRLYIYMYIGSYRVSCRVGVCWLVGLGWRQGSWLILDLSVLWSEAESLNDLD